MSYPQQLEHIVEGALLAVGKPMTVNQIKSLFSPDDHLPMPSTTDIKAALVSIGANCQGRGFELKEVAGGWRFQVRDHLAPWINRLWEEKPQKYSRALLETLALIAYRQPITRGEIEEVRGVAVSSNILRTLIERDWVKIVGYKESPGRPSLLATTRRFLDYFNLRSLEELPSLAELADIAPAADGHSSSASDAGSTSTDSSSEDSSSEDSISSKDRIVTDSITKEEGAASLPVVAVKQASANDSENDMPTENGDTHSEEIFHENATAQDEKTSEFSGEATPIEEPSGTEINTAASTETDSAENGPSVQETVSEESQPSKAVEAAYAQSPEDAVSIDMPSSGKVDAELKSLDELSPVETDQIPAETEKPAAHVETELIPKVASESLFSASLFDQQASSDTLTSSSDTLTSSSDTLTSSSDILTSSSDILTSSTSKTSNTVKTDTSEMGSSKKTAKEDV